MGATFDCACAWRAHASCVGIARVAGVCTGVLTRVVEDCTGVQARDAKDALWGVVLNFRAVEPPQLPESCPAPRV